MIRLIPNGTDTLTAKYFEQEVYTQETLPSIPPLLLFLQWLDLRYNRYTDAYYSANGGGLDYNEPDSLYLSQTTLDFIDTINKTSIEDRALYTTEKIGYLHQETYRQRLIDLFYTFGDTYKFAPVELYNMLLSLDSRLKELTENETSSIPDDFLNVINSLLILVRYLLSLESYLYTQEYIKALLFGDKKELLASILSGKITLNSLSTLEIATLDLNSLEDKTKLLSIIDARIAFLTDNSDENELRLLLAMKKDAENNQFWSNDVKVLVILLLVSELRELMEATIITGVESRENQLENDKDKLLLFGITSDTETLLNKDNGMVDTRNLLNTVGKDVQNTTTSSDKATKLETQMEIADAMAVTESMVILDNGYTINQMMIIDQEKIKDNNQIIDNATDTLLDEQQWLTENKSDIEQGNISEQIISTHTDNITNSTQELQIAIDDNTKLQTKQGSYIKAINTINEPVTKSSPKFLDRIKNMDSVLSDTTARANELLSKNSTTLLIITGAITAIMLLAKGFSFNSELLDPFSSLAKYKTALQQTIGSLLNLLVAPLELLSSIVNIALCTIKALVCLVVAVIKLIGAIIEKISALIDKFKEIDDIGKSISDFFDNLGSNISNMLTKSSNNALCKAVSGRAEEKKDEIIASQGIECYNKILSVTKSSCGITLDLIGPSLMDMINEEVDRVVGELKASVENTINNFKSIADTSNCPMLGLPDLDFNFKLGLKGIGPFSLKIPYLDSKAIKC